jgi:hypothetical protein
MSSWRGLIVMVGFALATVSVACGDDAKEPEPVDPTSRQAATAEKGAEAIRKRKCVDCHGENMAGAVTKLPNQPDIRVELYPPNLTPDVETGLGDPLNTDPAKKGYTDELLARAIREGYDRADQQLCPQMKHFADMTDFEVYSIVKYLRALPPVKQKILRSVCPPLKTKEEQTASQ